MLVKGRTESGRNWGRVNTLSFYGGGGGGIIEDAVPVILSPGKFIFFIFKIESQNDISRDNS